MDIVFILSMIFLALTFLAFVQMILQKFEKDKSNYNFGRWAIIFLIIYIVLFSVWLIKINM